MSWKELLAGPKPFRFPICAYSEFMPPPYFGEKPYGEPDPYTRPPDDDLGWNISEFEQARELQPGLARIASHVMDGMRKLARGESHQLSKRLLTENPAWPPELAARAGSLPHENTVLLLPLALSRTQDDKGRIRWTLFGASQEGPSRPFWRSIPDRASLERLVTWAVGSADGLRILPFDEDPDLPVFAQPLIFNATDEVRTLITFRPFADLPHFLQHAYFNGTLRLLPCPWSLIFWHHAGYRRLSRELPLADQIPFLHLFPRSEDRTGLRIPQSGWLDEIADEKQRGSEQHGHRIVSRIRRTHRWQRVERHEDPVAAAIFDDPVTIALFSSEPDDVRLYGKPMARNVHIWTENYERLLDGPRASREEIASAENAFERGGRFGYRFFYPPMHVGSHSIFWHRPLVAKSEPDLGLYDPGLTGFMTAERIDASRFEMWPCLQSRPAFREAAEIFDHDPGHKRYTMADNVRKILEWSALLGGPLASSLARRLIHVPREMTLESWLAGLPGHSNDAARATSLVGELRSRIGPDPETGPSLTFASTASRSFEERYWRAIAALSEGEFRDKNNADVVTVNPKPAPRRGLDAVGDYLHNHYERLGALSADHVFRWETDFEFPWSEGWHRNQREPAERNIVVIIPGRNRDEAVIMADHYDTAYEEDRYYASRGGDKSRIAAAGADDNHSATAALMLAAETFLTLSRKGKLARDIWLVHLTGEEFPADCLGARVLCQHLIQGDLVLTARDGQKIDVSRTRVRGAFVLDMVAHNNDRDRDVFQIAPGDGSGAARLAWHAHLANERWNRAVQEWNASPDRHGRGRANRVESGATPPPLAEYLPLAGEVRPQWDPRSSLYNTDAQIFSDTGVPVVLFMENYDINRSGYHDTHDTMKNIDLDYGAALVSIAIETVADAACVDVLI